MKHEHQNKAAAELVREKAAEFIAAVKAARLIGLTVEISETMHNHATSPNLIEVNIMEITHY